MTLRQLLRRFGRYSRYFLYISVVLASLLAAAYGAARLYWPDVLARQGNIETHLSHALGHPVRIEQIEPYWDGLYPGIRATGVTVLGADARPSIRLAEARISASWLPLLWRALEFHSVVLDRPSLTLARTADGRLQVTGLETPTAGTPDALVTWLLKQRKLIVHEAELTLIDPRDDSAPLVLSRVDVKLRNTGQRHRLTVEAVFPPALCRVCSVEADISGDPRMSEWDGQIEIEARGLNVEKLPMFARERLPEQLRGIFDVALRSEWRAGRPRVVRGETAVNGLRLLLADLTHPLNLPLASADVSWRANEDGWRLDLGRLNVALTGQPWSVGRLYVMRTKEESVIQIRHVDVGDVTAFLRSLKAEHPGVRRWVELQPSGALDNVHIRVSGKLGDPSALQARAQLKGVSVIALGKFPGVKGLSGRLSFGLDSGEFVLDTRHFTLDMPTVFRAPLQAQRASGVVRWERNDDAWRVDGADLRVRSPDGSGTGSMRLDLPHDPEYSPVLRLRVDFRNADGAHAARYYPVAHLKPRVLAWMESSIRGGRITSGYLLYDGPVREFPFTAGQGRFELRAHVRDGIYRYLPGWAPVTQAEVDVAVDGAEVVVTGHGKVGQLKVSDARVQLHRSTDTAESQVTVRARVEGPVAESVRVLQTATPRHATWPEYARLISSASGTGVLDLDLHLPLGARDEDHRWSGEYRFTQAALKLSGGAGLEAASGSLRLSDSGLDSGRVQGRLFGGPLTLVAAQEAGALRVRVSGQVRLPSLLSANPALAERVDGTVDWSGTWNSRRQGPEVNLEARLNGLRTRLPAPLNRPEGGFPEVVRISTEQSRPDSLVLALQAGGQASGRIALRREQDRWRFVGGRIEFGKTTAVLPRVGGMQVGLTAEALDIDAWLALRRERAAVVRSATEDDNGVAVPALPWVSADIKNLTLFGRRWGRMMAHFTGADREWKAVFDGDATSGEGRFIFGDTPAKSRLQLELAYLRLPHRPSTSTPGKLLADDVDPRRLPTIDLNARSFEYRERRFGELQMRAVPYDQGWRIERVNVSRPEAALSVNGFWRARGDQQTSDFNIGFESHDMGATLDAWGAPEQMTEGKVTVSARLTWAGSPMTPTLAAVKGKIDVKAEKGRFLQVKAGAARLFGLLDLSSIGRYLTLDFSPAFGKGFVFDTADAVIRIDAGNAYTNDFAVKGPALELAAQGRVGLTAEDFDLVIDASPKLSDTLTLASWSLFGPQAAAAVFAIQKLFKRQIQKGTRITYVVKGPWSNAAVTKVERQAPASDTP